jgi:hypothetical protein
MVSNSRKALCPGTSKPVNLPEPVRVEESDSGRPVTVKMPARQIVTALDDCWRIDDEWWRSEPISRLYYTIRLASGQRWVIYKDLISQAWYRQTY